MFNNSVSWGVFRRSLTLILLQKYRDTNGRRIVIQIGGVYTTFCHTKRAFFWIRIAIEMGGVSRDAFQKYRGQGSIRLSSVREMETRAEFLTTSEILVNLAKLRWDIVVHRVHPRNLNPKKRFHRNSSNHHTRTPTNHPSPQFGKLGTRVPRRSAHLKIITVVNASHYFILLLYIYIYMPTSRTTGRFWPKNGLNNGTRVR